MAWRKPSRRKFPLGRIQTGKIFLDERPTRYGCGQGAHIGILLPEQLCDMRKFHRDDPKNDGRIVRWEKRPGPAGKPARNGPSGP
jgi:hypothetical protein